MRSSLRSVLHVGVKSTIVGSVCGAALLAAACGPVNSDGAESAEDAVTASANDDGQLGQGWSEDATAHYEHTSDGSGLIPYKWLLALEQIDNEELFLADAHVRKFGFIPSPKGPNNPDGLPVGLAKQARSDKMGSTCSSCHEGEITFRGQTMRIHGGQGNAQITPFFRTAYEALARQLLNPAKFKRFADRVHGETLTIGKLALFFETVKTAAEVGLKVLVAELQVFGTPNVELGPYRNDAIGGGVNRLAGSISRENFRQATGPVSMPHLWDTPRFDWVEYNGAFQQPMGRNVVSALARGADIAFVDDGKPGLPNSVDLVKLHEIETQLGKLRAPRWPASILGAIDGDKAARGKTIYFDKAKCASCHNPPQDSRGFFQIKMVPLDELGTDPAQANNWADRTVDMNGKLGLGVIPVAEFARMATQAVMDRNYFELGISAERREEMNGGRPNGFRMPRAYRARPLDGTWATGPYLHNGSVPTLFELLLPEEKRSKTFRIGSKEMDPKRVGLVTEGDFVFDTRIDGNRNTGHSGPRYGTDLPDDERSDLLEYLKTL